MSYFSWLRSRTSYRAPRKRALQRPAAPRFRPRLEALEDRTLPSGGLPYPIAANTMQLIADINTANKASSGSTITLAANTTFDLTQVDNTTNGANGLPVINKTVTIFGQGGDVIQRDTAAPAFRLLDVAKGASLTLENVTLQGGLAFGSGAAADGGAIYNEGTLALSGATVQNNIAHGSNGANGAITPKLKQFQSSGNGQAGADAAGGGIWSSGTMTLQSGTTLRGNQALGGQGGAAGFLERGLADGGPLNGNGGVGGGGLGGGLYEAGGSVKAANATVALNEASGGAGGGWNRSFGLSANVAGVGGAGSGGGLYVADGALSLSSTTVQADQALGGTGGGGLAHVNAVGGKGSGGGIYVAGGTVKLATVELLSNIAQGGNGGGALASGEGAYGAAGGNAYGGGLYVAAGTVTLTNDTVTGNEVIGGQAGLDPFPVSPGAPSGSGLGGDMFIAAGATVYLDAFTVAHTGWIDGTYILLS